MIPRRERLAMEVPIAIMRYRQGVGVRSVVSGVAGVAFFLLAIYTGSAVNPLTKVVGNNNFPVPGLGANGSLVQFDAVAATTYSVHVGSVGGQHGAISLNVFQFPPI